MKLSKLKPIRVILSIIFLLAITVITLDISHALPYPFFKSALYLQFVPSLIKFLTVPVGIASGFIVIILLTLFFGRVYCSAICPLGILQDIISFISKKTGRKKKRYKYGKPHNLLRYSLLLLTIIAFVAGSLFLINLLDPYSNYTRIISDLVRPGYIWLNNQLASIFESYDIYYFSKVDYYGIRYELLAFPVIWLLLVIWMSWKYGRLYCNTVCPVGTLLGLFSKYSIFKIAFNLDACTECGACERACKASCIDYKDKKLDFDRCVSCFNCLKACPSGGFKYEYAFSEKQQSKEADHYKREMLKSSATALIGLSGIAIAQNNLNEENISTVPENRQNPSTPPGSLGIDHFTDACTACHLCISACPTQVLQPAFLEYGALGILQPKMDYHKSFCNYECHACSNICPSGAILPVKKEEKVRVQIGIAKFIEKNCIVYTEENDCGACAEHCPTKAVHMVAYKNNLTIPKVNEDTCVGCGACEFACPTKPYKAIYVEGNRIHQTAAEPKFEELDKDVDYEEDFPF